MRLGHTDGQVAEALLLEGFQLAARCQVVLHTFSPVDLGGYGLDLLLQRGLVGVEKPELGWLLGRLGHGFGQLDCTLAALREVVADGDARAHLLRDLPDGVVLRVVVRGEGVDRHHRRDAVQTGCSRSVS